MELNQALVQAVKITLDDGKEYTMNGKLNSRILAAIQDRWGFQVFNFFNQAAPLEGWQRIIQDVLNNPGTAVWLTYQLMVKNHPDLTEDDLGEMVGADTLYLQLLPKLSTIMLNSLPTSSEEKKALFANIEGPLETIGRSSSPSSPKSAGGRRSK